MNEYLAATKHSQQQKLQELENSYKQSLQRMEDRLAAFESGAEFVDILRTYNDQMYALEKDNQKCLNMVRQVVSLQFSKLKLEIEDELREQEEESAVDKRFKLLDYNFKKMQQQVKKQSQQMEA